MQIQYKKTPWWQRTFSVLCTLGAASLLRRRTIRLRPAAMDEQGIQLCDGTHVTWGQFESIHNPLARIEDAVAERLVLIAPNRVVPVNFDQMVDGNEIKEYFWSQWSVDIKAIDENVESEMSSEGIL